MTSAYEINRKKNRPKLQPTDFLERYKNRELGKQSIDDMITGLENDWNELDDGVKQNIIGFGNFIGNEYKKLRTVEEQEKFDPSAYITAGAIRTGEFALNTIGKVSDFIIGNPARGLGWLAGLDPRGREALAIGAQLYLGPKALKQVTKLKPKHLGFSTKIEPYVAPKGIGKVDKKMINITADAVDETFNLNADIFRRASKIYKANPNIGMKKAIQEAKLLEGFTPSQLITDKTFGSIKKGGLFDPKRDDTTRLMFTGSMGGLGIGDVGIPGLKSTTRKKITTPEFIDKRFIDYGFTKKGENGGWIFDEKVYNSLSSNQRREIAQIFQTDIDQTVPQSFTKEKNIKNLAFSEDFAEHNLKYGARPELHHDFPSALSAPFYFGLEYMSDDWRAMTAIANEFGNYPGQPMTEGSTNLVTLPSKIGSNHPNYFLVKERFGNVPPHLHNIVHSQFFSNETGMTGDKFFTPQRVNKMNKSLEDRMEVFREYNEIVARNRELWTEGLKQLDIFFGKIPQDYHDDLVRMLEEYLEKGMITIAKGKVKDRFGDLVKTPDGKLAEANYAQFSVQDVVRNALADFKADFNNDILGKNPRFKEVEIEVSNLSLLNESEKLDAALLLYKIKHYNGLKMLYGTRRAGAMVGLNVKTYNEALDQYMSIINDRMPNDDISILTKEQLKLTTFKDLAKPTIIEQLEIEFPDDG
tara:strand:+ start:196 stop:2286 length:2091 start_codon:yes stop_codon:yes gene_type:complete